ncbi:hypothetical protein MMC30_008597 [Trapelia coarctata]|nr:hypothetical protein [Trapelia coarctata]
MARRQDKHQDRPLALQITAPFPQHPSNDMPNFDEDEPSVDVDEPPDHNKKSNRLSLNSNGDSSPKSGYFKLPPLPAALAGRRESLLTQALQTSPDLQKSFSTADSRPMSRARSAASTYSNTSVVSMAELTSDGGITSPARTNTPSPPLPPTNHMGLALLTSKGLEEMGHILDNPTTAFVSVADPIKPIGNSAEPLGRKRCITFACGGAGGGTKQASEVDTIVEVEAPNTTKRPCMLRFACPTRPDKGTNSKGDEAKKGLHPSPPLSRTKSEALPALTNRGHRDSQSTVTNGSADTSSVLTNIAISSPDLQEPKLKTPKYKIEEDSWILETPRARRKITVSDTLRKENAIRKLGEEAEKEALEEEEAENDAELNGDAGDFEDDDEGSGEDDDASDGGNESDDEEGFADSDDEDEVDSEYQFWVPALSTAATSTDQIDQIDHIRPTPRRAASQSSIESAINTDAVNIQKRSSSRAQRKASRHNAAPNMRPGTPELPDSTDFVCGTLDEDKALEDAYVSYLEQHKLAKRGLIPQDLDPSFPTSDPDDDDDDDGAAGASDDNMWVTGRPDESDEGQRRGRVEGGHMKMIKSPAPSPRRFRSPPPKRYKSPLPNKRGHNAHSPAPRHLFGQSPKRLRSPLPRFRDLKSPPSSRRPSLLLSPKQTAIDMPRLAERPNLTHTKSLPRTPNPYWSLEALKNAPLMEAEDATDRPGNDLHSRGPIGIVQGLERKRQRQKEKLWRQHCRNGTKDKERRCQPGKGAQRMRELGLEMADRNKAYGQRAEVVLSV